MKSHHPYDTAAPFAGSVDPAALLKPPSFSDTYKNKPQNYRSTKEHWKCLDGMSWEEMSRVLAVCYEHAMVVDSGLDKILNQLDTAGFLENTVVILTADHGDQLASHGGLFNKDTLMVEEVMKVPLVIRWPERVKAGEKDYVPVANIPGGDCTGAGRRRRTARDRWSKCSRGKTERASDVRDIWLLQV